MCRAATDRWLSGDRPISVPTWLTGLYICSRQVQTYSPKPCHPGCTLPPVLASPRCRAVLSAGVCRSIYCVYIANWLTQRSTVDICYYCRRAAAHHLPPLTLYPIKTVPWKRDRQIPTPPCTSTLPCTLPLSFRTGLNALVRFREWLEKSVSKALCESLSSCTVAVLAVEAKPQTTQ